MRLIHNRIAIQPEDRDLTATTEHGIILFEDNPYALGQDEKRPIQFGKVVGVPDEWNTPMLQQTSIEAVGSRYEELGVTISPPDVRVGDTIAMLHTVQDMARRNFTFDGAPFGIEGDIWLLTFVHWRMFPYVIRDGKLLPLGASVIVRPILEHPDNFGEGNEVKSEAGIILPFAEKETRQLTGVVYWAGPDSPVQEGDQVWYEKYSDIRVPIRHPDFEDDKIGFWAMDGIADVAAIEAS